MDISGVFSMVPGLKGFYCDNIIIKGFKTFSAFYSYSHK